MTEASWDDYVATDADDAVAQVQSDVDTVADDVDGDPSATEQDELDVVDAQSSSWQAGVDQSSADASSDQGDWQAQQAQEWSDYAQGAAAEGLDDLAANAADTAGSYADASDSSYADAASSETDVSSDLDDTASAVSDIGSGTDYSSSDDTGSDY